MPANSKQPDPAIAGLIATDSLVPERAFYGIYASRPVFAKWRKAGLQVHRINGHVFVRPSELQHWLDKIEQIERGSEL